jgi:hypothetical protein
MNVLSREMYLDQFHEFVVQGMQICIYYKVYKTPKVIYVKQIHIKIKM